LLNSFTKEDYLSGRVNLHVHTNLSDGLMSPHEVLNQAYKGGMEYVSIVDHNCVLAHEQIQDKKIITGVEFDCIYKMVLIHILGYGIKPESPHLKPFLAKDRRGATFDIVRIFSLRNAARVIEAIHKAGGVAVFAHPACSSCLNLEWLVKSLVKLGLDGLEVYYPYQRHRGIIKFHRREEVLRLAQKYSLIATGGTDEHGTRLLS